MDNSLEKSRQLILEGHIEEAITLLDRYLKQETAAFKDEAFYLLGNAYRKQGNFQEAIQYYMEAMELNPQSPAAEAHRMMIDILNFYDKNMYNH